MKPPRDITALTPREIEVLKLVAEGFSTREIAEVLHISLNTASCHRARMMDKIGVHRAAEVAAYAILHGHVDPQLTRP